MNEILKKLFDIREGEGVRASLMFFYVFLLIASLLIVKPVRNSLFITYIGSSQLPYVYILVAIVAAIIISLYTKYSKQIRLSYLLYYTLVVSITIFFISWLMLTLNYQADWFYYTFYVWVALFGVLTTSQFWLLANYVFNAREAKRLFGFIGAGAISGGIFGGYLTNFLAHIIGTANLIFFCITFLFISIFIMKYVWRRSARYNFSERLQQEKRVRGINTTDNPIKLLSRSKHLSYLAAIIGISVIVANLVDFQFLAVVEDRITDTDARTEFIGFWLSNLSVVSLLIQLLLTRQVLNALGVTFSLVFLPIGIVIGALSILINPALWSAVLIKVSEGSFKQSINKAGLELIALPIPTTIKNQGKSFIDIFIDSLATGIGGILLIILISQFGVSVKYISFIIVLLIGFWFYFIHKVRQEYINSFRLALEKRTIDFQSQNISLEDASIFKSIVNMFKSDNDRHILYALQLIEDVKNDDFIPHLEKLIDHRSDDVKVHTLKILHQYDSNLSAKVKSLVQSENFDVKVEAIRYLHLFSTGDGKFLKESLKDEKYQIRTAALIVAAEEYKANKSFREEIEFKNIFDDFVNLCYESNHGLKIKEFTKINLAKVIGITKNSDLFPFLEKLLLDNSTAVIESAIINAGFTRDPMFIPVLIRHLNTNIVRKSARQALAEYSDDIIDVFEEYLANSNVEQRIRLGIPKVLALIGTQNSVDLLVKNLDQNNLMLRLEIIKALSNLREEFSFLKFNIKLIEKRVIKESEKYFKTMAIYYTQESLFKDLEESQKNGNTKKAKNLLEKTIEEKLENSLETIFRLLGLLYYQKDINNTYAAILSGKSDLHANAIEFLDNVLEPRLKRMIIPIVERSSAVRKDIINRYTDIKEESKSEVIRVIFEDDDNWLKACTMYFMAESGIKESEWMLKKFTTETDPIIRETAELTLERLQQ